MKIVSVTKNTSVVGSLLAAMSCPMCFPVLASFGASIGLGFLSQFEALFINTLLPIFAGIALASGIYSWYSHGNHSRGFLSILGPSLVLLALLVFWTTPWGRTMFYLALGIMFAVSIWDLISPPYTICKITALEPEK